MRILYVSYLYHPESGALPQRVHNLTQRWAAVGHDVTILAGIPNHPNGKIYPGHRIRALRTTYTEWDGEVKICRIAYLPLPNRGAINRFLSFASFAATAALRSLFMRPYDVVIGTIPQPFGPFASYIRTRLGHAKFVLDVRDLWPEGLLATGHASESSVSYRLIGSATSFLYKRADHIISVTDGIQNAIVDKHGLDPRKFSVVRAAVDPAHFRNNNNSIPLEISEHVRGKFVICYVGTLGNAHELGVLVEAAKLLEESHAGKFAIVIAGSGAEEPAIRNLIEKKHISNVLCTGLIDRDVIPGLLSASDLGVVSLRRHPVFETVVPTKIYEYLAAGLPIVSNVSGEAQRVIEVSGGGITIPAGSAPKLAQKIVELSESSLTRQKMAESGQAYVDKHISWDAAAKSYLSTLEQTVAGDK